MGDLHKFDEYPIIWNYWTQKLLRHCSVNKIWNRINNNDKIVIVIIIILAKRPRKVLQLGTQLTKLEQRPCKARSEAGPVRKISSLSSYGRDLTLINLFHLHTDTAPQFL